LAAARRRIDARGTQDLPHRGRRDRYAEHSQAEYPANQQVDDLEQHAASQPSRRSGSGEGTGQPRNRLFERHRLPTGALLTGPERQVLALAYFGGCTQAEIATIIGAPLTTVIPLRCRKNGVDLRLLTFFRARR